MTYVIIDRDNGFIEGSFDREEEALAYLEEEIQVGDEWDIVWFGPKPTDNKILHRRVGKNNV